MNLTPEQCLKKFKNSEALLNESIMKIASTEHFDWVAVVMYYGASYLVEKNLAEKNVFPKGHPDRNKLARRYLKAGKTIHEHMDTLYNASMDARYENIFYTREDIKDLAESYQRIKNILGTN